MKKNVKAGNGGTSYEVYAKSEVESVYYVHLSFFDGL